MLGRHAWEVIKLVVGILKGAVIGGAVGYGAWALETATRFHSPWLTYGVIGALVGLIAGKPIWSLIRDKNATSWVSVLKAMFGFGAGCGLFALISRVLSLPTVIVMDQDVFTWPVTVGAGIGAVLGGLFELDDAIGDDRDKAEKAERADKKLTPGKKA